MGVGRRRGVVTWRLGRVKVDGRAETPDPRRGVEVEGNVEITLAGADGGGGGFDVTSLLLL